LASTRALATGYFNSNLRVDDHGPAFPAVPFARTRHQSRCAGSEPTVSCETMVTCVKVSGAENDSELSISMVYEAAPATSLQLNATLAPRENLASLAGLDSVGAVGHAGASARGVRHD